MFESYLYNKLYNINQERMQKITAQNIRAGVNIFGTEGNYTSDSNAEALDIASGKTAYVNGTKLTGSLKEYNENTPLPVYNISLDVTNSNINAIFLNRISNNGSWQYFSQGVVRYNTHIPISYNLITSKIGLQPTDIKKDVKVLDIIGTYDASTEFEGIKMDPVTPSSTAVSLTKSISEISGLDTANGTNMYGFFSNLQGLISVSNLDLTNSIHLGQLFYNDSKLSTIKHIDMYNSDIENVPMAYTFYYCNSLTNIDETVRMPKTISQASGMFYGCRNLTNINTPINIRSTQIDQMFAHCVSLESIDSINFIAPSGSVSAMNLFYNCRRLNFESLNLTGFNLQGTSNMFQYSNISSASLIENIFNNLSNIRWQTGMFAHSNIDNVPNIDNFMHIMPHPTSYGYAQMFDDCFYNCQKITIGDLNLPQSNWYNSYRRTFMNCSNLISSNINLKNDWKVTNHWNAYNFQETYSNCLNLETVNINCNNSTFLFSSTFCNCRNLRNVTMPTNWVIANNSFTNVFYNCENIENLDSVLDKVLTTNNIYLTGAFSGCRNLKYDKEITFNIDTLSRIGNVFAGCSNITNNLIVNLYVTNNTYPTNAGGMISGSGFNSAHYIINYTNLSSTYYSECVNKLVSDCNNIKEATFNITLNSIKQNPNRTGVGFVEMVTNCPNVTKISYNFAMYNDYHRAFSNSIINNCANLIDLDIDIVYGKINNTSISTTYMNCSNICYAVTRCNSLTSFNLNLNIGVNLANFEIARDCPNLTDINYNIVFSEGYTCIYNYITLFKNCPNLSDTLIDNMLGILHNIPNYRGTKKLSIAFNYCNISNIRFESLNNYANVVADGWTLT